MREKSDEGGGNQELETNWDTTLGSLYLPLALPSSSSHRPNHLIQLASLGPALVGVGTEGSCLG